MNAQELDIRWPELVADLAGLTSKKTLAQQVNVNPKEISRWIRGEARPHGDHINALLRLCDEYGTNWRKYSKIILAYDHRSEYEENLQSGPQGIRSGAEVALPRIPTQILGRTVNSPVGIPASCATINSTWIRPYSRLGFDIFTYKTCRTGEAIAHTFPNIAFLPLLREPIALGKMPVSTRGSACLPPCDVTKISAANSFGMPSPRDPKVWQDDVQATLRILLPGQMLIVSIVGTPGAVCDLVADFVRCAHMAYDLKPHAIEVNFSCPNVYEKEQSTIYQSPEVAGRIVDRIRAELRDVRLLVKIGYLRPDKLAELFKATYKKVDGYTAINTIPMEILSEKGEPIFPGGRRKKAGVSGAAIRLHARETVAQLRVLAKEYKPELTILGTGGVSSLEDFKSMREAGADGVQICTAALINPYIAAEIRKQLVGEQVASNRSRYLDRAGLKVHFSDGEIGLAWDAMLQACEEANVAVDKGFIVLQREWLSPYVTTMNRIKANDGDEAFVSKTRRTAPTKDQIIRWLRCDAEKT